MVEITIVVEIIVAEIVEVARICWASNIAKSWSEIQIP